VYLTRAIQMHILVKVSLAPILLVVTFYNSMVCCVFMSKCFLLFSFSHVSIQLRLLNITIIKLELL
jgi:hypothetical protein